VSVQPERKTDPVASPPRSISRRALLGSAALAAGTALAACGGTSGSTPSTTRPANSGTRRGVGIPPAPDVAVGTDMLPEVDHIVVVMLENHSFDNVLGVLGRGDGLPRAADGSPSPTNPDGHGNLVRAFHMPTPCQQTGRPSQTWNDSHIQFSGGTNQGFVISLSGPVAMGYWTPADMPFTSSLARTYPLADRWHCSVLAQTYPNRRYLISGTSLGLVGDSLPLALPPNGTIFDALNRHGITWKNYYSSLPTAAVYLPLYSEPSIHAGLAPIGDFFDDCRAGTLPSFSLVDPDFDHTSEEDPQDIQFGDVFLSEVVNAVTSGPGWSKSLLVWCYDEHGGYYDHVPPPPAVTPDDVPPALTAGELPGSFDRYGFRVPAGLVSPYARPDHVSSTVYDHTSVLRLVETKWNLPALTRRDAAANDLLDMVDFHAPPHFLHPPALAAPADPALRDSCQSTGPGTIPPASAVVPAH